jgi:hypothetical protein
MLKSLVYSDSLGGIKSEHFLDQVDGVRVSPLEHSIEVFAFPLWQTLNKFLVLWDCNLFNKIFLRITYKVSN